MIKNNTNKNVNKAYKTLRKEFIKELLGAQKEKTIKVREFSEYYRKNNKNSNNRQAVRKLNF